MTPLPRLLAAPLVLFTLLPAAARASDRAPASNTIVVVVEAPTALLDPVGLRRVLTERLERPCVSLLDADAPAASAVLSIVLDADGHGRIELHPRGGIASYVSVVRPRRAARSGAWLAAATGELISAGMNTPDRRYAPCREVIDPWPPTSVEAARATRLELPSAVLDPCDHSRNATARSNDGHRPMVRSEVLDPWAGQRTATTTPQPAEALSRPRPSVHRPRR